MRSRQRHNPSPRNGTRRHRTIVDAILSDHVIVESIFRQYEQAAAAGDARGQQQVAYEIVRTMSKHAAKEEMTL
ncbi:hypothetical protein [Priestia aryabhattai]